MSVLIGFLSFILCIVLIIGLANPALVLRWSNQPTQSKVIGYTLLCYAVLAIIYGITATSIKEQNNTKTVSRETETPSIDISEEQEVVNNIVIHEETIENEEINKLKEGIEREINSINKGIDFTEYYKSPESLKWELILFNVWAQRVKEGENSNDVEVQNLTKILKNKAIEIQIKEFPKLRELFAKHGEQQIAAKNNSNIKINVDRKNNSHINFTGNVFMLESTAETLHETIESTLIDFRFHQAQYKKYEGDEGYIYFNLNSPYDNELYVKDI